MIHTQHRYVLELSRADRSAVGESTPEFDWEPAVEWTSFTAARDRDAPLGATNADATVAPIWAQDRGEPFVDGFRVSVPGPGGAVHSCEFGRDYVEASVRESARQFVLQGRLEENEPYSYDICAYDSPNGNDPKPGFVVKVAPAALAIEERPLADLLARSRELVAGRGVAGDVPVFIPQGVIDEATDYARARAAEEVGGLMIGRIWRDPRLRTLFAEVTAQIPAVHTQSTATRLTFTSESWAAAESAVRLRGRGEIWLGWHHSHPAREWCKNCSPERQAVCPMTGNFFSPTDVALHRTVFAPAYCVALVVTDSLAGIDVSLFGWRCGRVQPRSFRVIDA